MFSFSIQKELHPGEKGKARLGTITTSHGTIQTPAFVAVGTKGTVKSLSPAQVREAGTQVALANTYHMYLEPGAEVVRGAGGLGKFMHWDGPTMTDSGGYQVFSLGVAYKKGISKVLHPVDPSLQIPERSSADEGVPRLATIGNDGVSFQSHLDGSLHYITPEKSIEIQHALGADMIFAFDECTSPTEDVRYQEEALARTHAWAARCLKRHHELKDESEKSEVKLGNTPDALFGVVQGGREEELRKKSAQVLADMRTEDGHEYDGFGIGGSFAKEDMGTAVRWVNEVLPEDKPRHLLGIGEPEDLFMGVENGCDLFDCVLPTRNGRNGTIFTHQGKIHIENAKYRQDYTPIEEGCGCYACQNFTRAYVCHLFHGKEMLAGTLASIHNLYFINNLMERIRASIADGTFYELKESFLVTYTQK